MQDILLFLTGIVVGGMNAIAGGGMLIGFPMLVAIGLSPLSANATGNLALLPGQLTAVYGYRRYIKKRTLEMRVRGDQPAILRRIIDLRICV